jgi:hypothetical protein
MSVHRVKPQNSNITMFRFGTGTFPFKLVLLLLLLLFLLLQDLQMERYLPVARFGLMHMIATNLCEWLYVLVEETKHEIEHLSHHSE